MRRFPESRLPARRRSTREELNAAIAPLATREELRAAIREDGERTRRHFDVVAERLESKIRVIAEGYARLDATIDVAWRGCTWERIADAGEANVVTSVMRRARLCLDRRTLWARCEIRD